MALSIKDEQTDRLVRQYARLRGTSYTSAIRLAVTDALRRAGEPIQGDTAKSVAEYLAFIEDIQARVAALPALDGRDPDEILYDEDGLPH